jgi:hypothetical protein
MANDPVTGLRWGVRKRLEFIDFRLLWHGRFTRAALAEAFGMSAQQATTDIALYQEMAPQNLRYDHPQRSFLRTPEYSPLFVGESADRYLLQLVAVDSGWMRQDETWFETLPPIDVASLSRRPTDPKILLGVLDSLRARTEISVDYLSMTGTPESLRQIAPHAMDYCAGRWYVRAWSRDHNDFRYYNLNRIKAVQDSTASTIDPALDYEWAHTVELLIAPNPGLSAQRREAVETEYRMEGGVLAWPVRLSLSFFLMSEHNLDVEPGLLSPEKQQLVLTNREEIENARRLARQMSKQALSRADGS